MFFFYLSLRPLEIRIGRLPSEGLHGDLACPRCIRSLRDDFKRTIFHEVLPQCQATNFSHIETQTPPLDRTETDCTLCQSKSGEKPSTVRMDVKDDRLPSYGKLGFITLVATLTNPRDAKVIRWMLTSHCRCISKLDAANV